MPLKIQLKSTGSGQAQIDIKGAEISGKRLEIQIQRASDDAYIGDHGSWQAEPKWHRLQRMSGTTAPAFLAEQDIVDALTEVARSDSFLAQMRWERGEGQGVLSIRGELVSSAAVERPPKQPIPTDVDVIEPEIVDPVAPGQPKPTRAIWPWVAGIAAAVVALLLLALWLGGWLDSAEDGSSPGPAQTDQLRGEREPKVDDGPKLELDQEETPPNDGSPPNDDKTPDLFIEPEPGVDPKPITPAPPGPPVQPPAPEPPLEPIIDATGSDYVNQLIAETKDPELYMAHARQQAMRGDCDAVRLLYQYAAAANPKLAGQVAALYDPQGFEASDCIRQPSLINAQEYYRISAEGGVPIAQRRLGEILITDHLSGPDYQDGVIWLQKAASAGDGDAQRVIDGLNYRSFQNR